jgi:hypothetical protein
LALYYILLEEVKVVDLSCHRHTNYIKYKY